MTQEELKQLETAKASETPEEGAVRWIKGLLNTKELQTTNQLGNKIEGYCCLGYGCVIEGIRHYNETNTGSTEEYKSFRDAVGLTNQGESSCIDYNDFSNYSFEQIADRLIKSPSSHFKNKSIADAIRKEFRS